MTIRVISTVIFLMVYAGCWRSIGPQSDSLCRELEVLVSNMATTQSNESQVISVTVSNRSDRVINVWKASDDGFGCSIETLNGGNWKDDGRMFCATFREHLRLSPGEYYNFKLPVACDVGKFRVMVEYWEDTYDRTNFKCAYSLPFTLWRGKRNKADDIKEK